MTTAMAADIILVAAQCLKEVLELTTAHIKARPSEEYLNNFSESILVPREEQIAGYWRELEYPAEKVQAMLKHRIHPALAMNEKFIQLVNSIDVPNVQITLKLWTFCVLPPSFKFLAPEDLLRFMVPLAAYSSSVTFDSDVETYLLSRAMVRRIHPIVFLAYALEPIRSKQLLEWDFNLERPHVIRLRRDLHITNILSLVGEDTIYNLDVDMYDAVVSTESIVLKDRGLVYVYSRNPLTPKKVEEILIGSDNNGRIRI